ncbi:MAG TPA: hypothetical protein VK886_18955 [Vicinamibacterales bacterium]|nr:hypothetical protein [Vicinamibacterales bacterium]
MLALAGACGGAPTAPSVSAGDSPVHVNPSDRLAWNQSATSHAELGRYEFGVYVDGERVLLASVACEGTPPNVYDCTAPLPALPAGRHTLELVAISRSGLFAAESPRSAPLTIIVGSAAGPSAQP